MTRAVAALLITAALAALSVTVLILIDVDLTSAVSATSLHVRDPIRPLVVAAIADAVVLLWLRHARLWRAASLCIAAIIGILALILIARQGPPAAAFGDGAMIELYTRHASRGQQLLGRS